MSDQLLPALEDSQLSKAAREAATQLSHLDVNKFPLGFTTRGTCCLVRRVPRWCRLIDVAALKAILK